MKLIYSSRWLKVIETSSYTMDSYEISRRLISIIISLVAGTFHGYTIMINLAPKNTNEHLCIFVFALKVIFM